MHDPTPASAPEPAAPAAPGQDGVQGPSGELLLREPTLPAIHQDAFKINIPAEGWWRRTLFTALAGPASRLLCLPQLNEVHRNSITAPGDNFWAKTMAAMRVSWEVSENDLARIPRSGPVVVVANHPFGGIEGVLLGALLQSVRPDVKIMGTYFLGLIPQLRDSLILVDNFGGEDSLRKNIQPLKESIRCLRHGHMLAVFPSGEVSHLNLDKRSIADPVWSPSLGRIIHKTEAPVLPIFFQGRNGLLFHLLGLIHPRLRTIRLPREFLNKQGHTFHISVGGLIHYSKLARLERDDELMAYLRLRTYMLQRRDEDQRPRRSLAAFFSLPKSPKSKGPKEPQQWSTPVESEQDPLALLDEIESLGPEKLLLESGKYRVYRSKAKHIPLCMKEIGRLREYSFRLVGEGTGKATDLDRFDAYYDHLFIWDVEAKCIVGAYRLAKTDSVIKRRGIEGLYTSTLFSFKPAMFERMGPAMEMGRSFIRPEYQRSFSALLLLWKGIGQYVLRNPDNKILFGPVSISSDYSSLSRELIVRILKSQNTLSEYSKLVKPKTPPRLKGFKRHEIREFRNVFSTVDDMTEVVTDLEKASKGIPILLKQYLKLGGKILSFNVDPEFNNCLDGLIFVDLTQTSPKILANYMGRDNVINFLDYHAVKTQSRRVVSR